MSSTPDPLDRIVLLEELFAHQEQLVLKLNQVIVRLGDEVDTLTKKLDQQSLRIQWLMNNHPGEPRSLEDDRPPHY